MNTLDWDKLEKFISERKPVEVSAGLLDDWFWTAHVVYKDGKYIEDAEPFVTSTWATPGFKAEMANGDTIEVVATKKETEKEAGERECDVLIHI